MARVNPIQNNYNSGELSQRTQARIDISKYPGALDTAVNTLSLPQGGITKRPGSRYVSDVEDHANFSRLLPFEFNVEQAYIIEAADEKFRFYRDQAPINVALTDGSVTNGTFTGNITGWTDNSGAGSSISHDATNDRLNLISNGSTNAEAEQAITITSTYQNNPHTVKFRVYGAAGDSILFQVGSASLASDVLVPTVAEVGFHSFSFTPGVTTFYIQFISDLGKTLQIDNVEILSDQVLEVTTPYQSTNLNTLKVAQSADVMYICEGGTTPVYKLNRLADRSWSVVQVNWEDGPYEDKNTTSTTLSASATTGLGITITASATEGINGGQGFLATDIGRLVRIQNTASTDAGYAIITDVTTTTTATADVRRDFNNTTAETDWWIGSWSETTGYPSALTFFEQRLALANISDNPQGFWLSQSADIENFRIDSFESSELVVEDDDSVAYTLAAQEVNAIRWLLAEKNLIIGTVGGEWIAQSSGSTITPNDVDVKRNASNGSANIQAILVNDSVIFVQRAGRKVYDFGFVFETDRFTGRDLTILADHISRSGVTNMAYQREPDSILWVTRNDGVVATLTYKPDQQVVGWNRQIMGGTFIDGGVTVDPVVESIAVIPGDVGEGRQYDSNERDEVWLSVKRTIDGNDVRYIEVLEDVFEGPLLQDFDFDEFEWKNAMVAAQADAFYVDSGITYDGAATDTITGLDHLEGEIVDVLADGAVHPQKTVTSGQITLDYEAEKVQVGLPYTSTMRTLKMAFGASIGTAVGKVKRAHALTFVLLDTGSFMYGRNIDNMREMPFREVGGAMDSGVPLFTGERKVDFSGQYARDPRITIQSTIPLPFTILAIAPEMQTNDVK